MGKQYEHDLAPVRIKRGRATVTLGYEAALEHMHQGAMLMLTRNGEDGDQYIIVAGGTVSDQTAARLKEHPALVVESDGLLPGVPQSWRIRSFVEVSGNNGNVSSDTTQAR